MNATLNGSSPPRHFSLYAGKVSRSPVTLSSKSARPPITPLPTCEGCDPPPAPRTLSALCQGRMIQVVTVLHGLPIALVEHLSSLDAPCHCSFWSSTGCSRVCRFCEMMKPQGRANQHVEAHVLEVGLWICTGRLRVPIDGLFR